MLVEVPRRRISFRFRPNDFFKYFFLKQHLLQRGGRERGGRGETERERERSIRPTISCSEHIA